MIHEDVQSRNYHYIRMGPAYLAVGRRNDIVGVLLPLNDRFIVPTHERLRNDSRAFDRHMINGQPKPMDMYFKKVR